MELSKEMQTTWVKEELMDILKAQGYFNLKEVPGKGICGLNVFMFTCGLLYGLDTNGYEGRYCFHSIGEAAVALHNWDGHNDPSGNWIKHKGKNDYSNPNYQKS